MLSPCPPGDVTALGPGNTGLNCGRGKRSTHTEVMNGEITYVDSETMGVGEVWRGNGLDDSGMSSPDGMPGPCNPPERKKMALQPQDHPEAGI